MYRFYCCFRLLLRKEGVNFKTTAEFEIVRTIKEKACYLAINPQKEETGATEAETTQYTLPDGSTLDVIDLNIQLFDWLLKFGRESTSYYSIYRLVLLGFVLLKFCLDLI